MTNVLILNGVELHQKFFKCIIRKDINLFHGLKSDIINNYNYMPNLDLPEDTEELFKFPNFKEEGKFETLKFQKDN